MPQKMIIFENKDEDWRDGGPGDSYGTMAVNGDPNDLRDPDKVVIRREWFYIAITYPLRDGAMVSAFTINPGKRMTRLELFKSIANAYRKVYRAPKRNGIWGHALDDLWLEGAQLKGGTLYLSIGS